MESLITTSSIDPTYPAFPVTASIGIVLILLPAYWHFKSGNVGMIMYIVWNFLGNLNYLVNSIAWSENVHTPPWLWCDFSAALIVALNVAVPTYLLLISRRLYAVANIQQMTISRIDSRRAKYHDFALGVGLPILAVMFSFVVQGHRFDIIENVGCWPSIYVTPVTIPLVFLPPILISMVTFFYSLLSVRAFLYQRKQFSSANPGLTSSRFCRLMALAMTQIVCSLPLSTYVMVTNIKHGMHPWVSWADTHLDFNRVETLPFGWFQLFPRAWILINLSRYLMPIGSFLFFIFLGMSGESGAFYCRQFWRLARLLGFSDPSPEASAEVSLISRRGVRAPSKLRSLPPFATSVSVTSTPKKEQELNAQKTGSRTNSLSDSLSAPLNVKAEEEVGAVNGTLPGIPPFPEVHSSIV